MQFCECIWCTSHVVHTLYRTLSEQRSECANWCRWQGDITKLKVDAVTNAANDESVLEIDISSVLALSTRDTNVFAGC